MIAFVVALFALAALAACDAPLRENIKKTGQALTTETCTTQAPCNITVPFFSGPQGAQFAVEANGELVLSDRSAVADAKGNPTAVVNTGATKTSLGADVQVGGVVSEAPVTIRAGAVVS